MLRAMAARPRSPVYAAAERHEAKVRGIVTSAYAKAQSAVSARSRELLDALSRDAAAVAQVVTPALATADEYLASALPDALLATLVDSAAGIARAARKSRGGLRGLAAPPQIVIDFDRTDPNALQWAREASAQLIKEISQETRAAVMAVIERAFEDGLPPRVAARQIRQLVGLTERQALAVVRLRFRLMDARPGSIVRAGKVAIRIPKSGVSADLIARSANGYAQRLHKLRSVTIARHETLAASNEGQHQLWRQAMRSGLLRDDEQRTPVLTPDDRLCETCRTMDGQLRGLTEPFTLPDGSSVMNPPFHVTCRCSQRIVPRSQRRKR
jgi:hypothetical protein